MKYSSVVLASVLTLAMSAQASDASNISEDELADIRSTCIEEGVAAELDDSQMEAFVEQCVNDELAAKAAGKNSQG